jgi:hypothetical protein
MQGEISVLDHHGDTKLMWDSERPDEVAAARKLFDDLKAKGYAAFKVEGKEGTKGEILKKFDPDIERIILAPMVAGG